jgi:hypothetical protein
LAAFASHSWFGKVKSKKKACRKDREVSLYMRMGEQNAEIGDAISEKGAAGGWVWKVSVDGAPDEGSYFALVAPAPGCKRAESKPFMYPEDNPFR